LVRAVFSGPSSHGQIKELDLQGGARDFGSSHTAMADLMRWPAVRCGARFKRQAPPPLSKHPRTIAQQGKNLHSSRTHLTE